MRSKPLGQLLVENGDVSSEQIAQAIKAQGDQGGMIGGILQRMGACSSEALGHALSKQVQVTDVQTEELEGSDECAKLVSKEICLREKLCPFEILGNLLCIVMGNPLNRKAITEIESISRMKVKAFKSTWPKISELIERTYAPISVAATKTHKTKPKTDELDDLTFDLEDDPASAPTSKPHPGSLSTMATASVLPIPGSKSGANVRPTEREALSMDDEDIIIPPSTDEEQAAPAAGILDLPTETIPLPTHGAHADNPFKPLPQPTIRGIDSLDFSGGEVIDVAKRKFGTLQAAPKKPPRVAKVNVDLENFDQSAAAEVIDTLLDPEHSAMDEIEHADIESGGPRNNDVLVALKIVPDGYFYSGNAPKNAPRSDDLMDIIEALPVAEVVAENIVEFETQKAAGDLSSPMESNSVISMSGNAMAGKGRVDLQRAPATPMAAIRLGEGEFQKLMLNLVEDEAGDWEWNYVSMGPVAVEAFEE